MLLRALATHSQFDELLADLHPNELTGVLMAENFIAGVERPLVTANVSMDRLLQIAKDLQAGVIPDPYLSNDCDRLEVTSVTEAGETIFDNPVGDITFWLDPSEVTA